jgi:hypothetical protein
MADLGNRVFHAQIDLTDPEQQAGNTGDGG